MGYDFNNIILGYTRKKITSQRCEVYFVLGKETILADSRLIS